MGVCCCKNEIQEAKPNELPQAEQKSTQQTKPSTIEMPNTLSTSNDEQQYSNDEQQAIALNHHINNNNPNNDIIANNDLNIYNDMPDDIKSSTHWKTQTLQLLSAISNDKFIDLGSDFEDYDDKQYHEPKQLVNKPRKRYLSHIPKDDDTKYDLHIGTTLNQSTENNHEQKCVWTHCSASHFKVRPLEYASNKRSKPKASKNALYDMIGMDCFEIDDKHAATININKMIQALNIEHTLKNIHTNTLQTKSTYPTLLIISLMIPLFKKKQRNGLHVLLYGQMSNEFENGLKQNEPAIQLLNKLMHLDKSATDNFKLTASIPNINETTLNSITKKLVKTINGKCMSFKKHAMFEYLNNENKDVFIVKFNGFGLNKQIIKGLSTVRDHLQTIDFEIGFHTGAKLKHILPERILLCAKINKLNMEKFMRFDEFCAMKKKEYNNNNMKRKHTREETYVMDDAED